MKSTPVKKSGVWQQSRLNSTTKKLFKKKWKQRLNLTDMQKIWSDYVDEVVIKGLEKGGIVNINKNLKLWVKATPMLDDKRMVGLLKKGLMLSSNGMKEANINIDTSNYKYKIVLENKLFKGDNQIFFVPHRNISKAVHEGIKKNKIITRFTCQ